MNPYIKSINGKPLIKENNSFAIKVTELKQTKNPDIVVVNGKYQLSKQSFVLISSDEYNTIQKDRINIGDIIKKTGNRLFKSTNYPILKVDTIRYAGLHHIIINDNTYDVNHITKVNVTEAGHIISVFDNLVADTVPVTYDEMHMTGDIEKRKYKNINDAKAVAYQKQMQRPEDKFQVYMCTYCNHYHVGKIMRQAKTIDLPKTYNEKLDSYSDKPIVYDKKPSLLHKILKSFKFFHR